MTGPGFEAVLVSLAGEVDVERSGGIGDPLASERVTRYTGRTDHYHEGAPDGDEDPEDLGASGA